MPSAVSTADTTVIKSYLRDYHFAVCAAASILQNTKYHRLKSKPNSFINPLCTKPFNFDLPHHEQTQYDVRNDNKCELRLSQF